MKKTEKDPLQEADRFLGEALHIFKQIAELEKKHKARITRAQTRLFEAYSDLNKDFEKLNIRIDAVVRR